VRGSAKSARNPRPTRPTPTGGCRRTGRPAPVSVEASSLRARQPGSGYQSAGLESHGRLEQPPPACSQRRLDGASGQPHRRTGGRTRPERRPSQGTAEPAAPNPGGSDRTDPHAQAGRPRATNNHGHCRPPLQGRARCTLLGQLRSDKPGGFSRRRVTKPAPAAKRIRKPATTAKPACRYDRARQYF